MVEKVNDYGVRKTILIGQESYYAALSVKVSGEANAVVKAGEPIVGDLTDRNTEFTVGTAGAVGINLHEVKLDKNGKGNATCVFRGVVDAKKLEAGVAANVKTANIAGIDLVEGSAI